MTRYRGRSRSGSPDRAGGITVREVAAEDRRHGGSGVHPHPDRGGKVLRRVLGDPPAARRHPGRGRHRPLRRDRPDRGRQRRRTRPAGDLPDPGREGHHPDTDLHGGPHLSSRPVVLPRRRPVSSGLTPSGLTPAGRVVTGLVVTGLVVAVLAGCGGSGPPIPAAAPQATSAGCRQALAVLPATVLGRARTPLDVAGAASWGEPGIVLRCGLAQQPPTGKPCLTVDGVDWV